MRLALLASLLLACCCSRPSPAPEETAETPLDAGQSDACALPNPGSGLCVHPAESCPPDDACWTWSCDPSGHCVAAARDAGP